MKSEPFNINEIEKMPLEELQKLAARMAYESVLRMSDPLRLPPDEEQKMKDTVPNKTLHETTDHNGGTSLSSRDAAPCSTHFINSFFKTSQIAVSQPDSCQQIGVQTVAQDCETSKDTRSSIFLGGTFGAVGATGIGATLGAAGATGIGATLGAAGATGIGAALGIPAGPLGAAIGAAAGATASFVAGSLWNFFSDKSSSQQNNANLPIQPMKK